LYPIAELGTYHQKRCRIYVPRLGHRLRGIWKNKSGTFSPFFAPW
jgi:hypothetical protein